MDVLFRSLERDQELKNSVEKGGRVTNDDEIKSSVEELDRVLGRNYEWVNLNPFLVLKLPVNATDEDVKQRYRKLSSLIHPDKMLGEERARFGFEQVKKAYTTLLNKQKKKQVIELIAKTHRLVKSRRKKLIGKGVPLETLGDEESAISLEVMKA